MPIWVKQIISTERGEFEVFTSGDGEPLCVSHLYLEFDENGNIFADRFVKHFTVVLVNLKEAGYSCRADSTDDLTMEASIEDLESIRKTLGYSTWSFAGNEAGGILGLQYAVSHPDSIRSLIVCGATASKDFKTSPNSLYNFDGRYGNQMRKILFTFFSAFSTPAKKQSARRRWVELSLLHPKRYTDYFAVTPPSSVVGKRLRGFLRDLQSYDVRSSLPSLTMPVLVLCGKHDNRCPAVFSEEIHRLVPGSCLTLFENSKHYPFLEEADTFAAIIGEFAVASRSPT